MNYSLLLLTHLSSTSWDDDKDLELREASSLPKPHFPIKIYSIFLHPTSPRHRSSSPLRTCRPHGRRRGVTQRTSHHGASESGDVVYLGRRKSSLIRTFSRTLSIMTGLWLSRVHHRQTQKKTCAHLTMKSQQ